MSQITISKCSRKEEISLSGKKVTDQGMKAVNPSCHRGSVSGVKCVLYFFKTLDPEGVQQAQVQIGTAGWKDTGVKTKSPHQGQTSLREPGKDSEQEIAAAWTPCFHLQEFSIHSPRIPGDKRQGNLGCVSDAFPLCFTGFSLKAWLPAKSVSADVYLD